MAEEERKLNTPLDPDQMYAELEEKIRSSHTMDLARIRSAYEMARAAHEGQKRKDGSPYVTHCVAAADISVDLGLDEDSIIAALLHDVIEDTTLTHADIAHEFGPAVADIVEGVTKLTRVNYTSREEEQMENMRKMLMAMSKDIRVILIKLADRLHNMRTMDYQSPEKQRLKSLETMQIYAPIAHRLGMQAIKWELEDLSLRYLDPVGYQTITDTIEARRPVLEQFMTQMEERISKRLTEWGIECTVYHRIKHIYSIYRKMYSQNKTLGQVLDLYAFRVIVDSIADCYNVLGNIHDMYKPIPGRFKDYIGTPKPNMYQSLHTTVIGREGIPFEVQIRTWQMHHTAEYGIAAHWKYKEGVEGKQTDEEKFSWIRRRLEAQQDSDAQDFVQSLKVDMFSDEVFVFTPKGRVISLPAGSTPIDFAYAIHSGVGNRCIGAKVNGRIVPLETELETGDRVEIMTSANAKGPSIDWLRICKTAQARAKIRQYLKKEMRTENIELGRSMVEHEAKHRNTSLTDLFKPENYEPILSKYGFQEADDIFGAVGYGGMSAAYVVSRLIEEQRAREPAPAPVIAPKPMGHLSHGIILDGTAMDVPVRFAHCCSPVPGDEIVGFVTRGRGVSIHKADCVNALSGEAERRVAVRWADDETGSFCAPVRIIGHDRVGLLGEITSYIGSLNVPIRSVSSSVDRHGTAAIRLVLEVRSREQMDSVMRQLRRQQGVIDVVRVTGG
jgi:GTP pyrophosphokinase